MNAVAIGPYLFTASRLAVIVAIVAFMFASFLLSRRYGRGLIRWSIWSVVIGMIAGRYGYVVMNISEFYPDHILRALAVWQGGFMPLWSVAAVLVFSAFKLRAPMMLQGGAIAMAITLVAWFGTHQLTKPQLMKPASPLVMEQVKGAPMSIAQATGKPVVINIWATWCPPCRREMPLLAEVAAANTDVTFLFVNQAEDADTVTDYLTETKLDLPHVLLDKGKRIPRYYGTIGIPVTLFLDAQGRLVRMYFGEIPRELLIASIDQLRDPGKPLVIAPPSAAK